MAYDNIMDFPGHFKDHIMPDKIHVINLSFLVNTLKRQRGGVAANIAYTMALLGAPPAVFSVGGRERLGRATRNGCKRTASTRALSQVVPDEFTATCYITTDLDNNQITGFYTGAMANDKELSSRSSPAKRLAWW